MFAIMFLYWINYWLVRINRNVLRYNFLMDSQVIKRILWPQNHKCGFNQILCISFKIRIRIFLLKKILGGNKSSSGIHIKVCCGPKKCTRGQIFACTHKDKVCLDIKKYPCFTFLFTPALLHDPQKHF